MFRRSLTIRAPNQGTMHSMTNQSNRLIVKATSIHFRPSPPPTNGGQHSLVDSSFQIISIFRTNRCFHLSYRRTNDNKHPFGRKQQSLTHTNIQIFALNIQPKSQALSSIPLPWAYGKGDEWNTRRYPHDKMKDIVLFDATVTSGVSAISPRRITAKDYAT